jgi:hypothetical protein
MEITLNTPTLKDMGINNPDQITRYETYQKSPRKDILKIVYKRKKGSLLPVRRVYEFGRALQTNVSDSGQPRYEGTYEVSPSYLSAITELDRLLSQRNSGSQSVDGMLQSTKHEHAGSNADVPLDRLAALLKDIEVQIQADDKSSDLLQKLESVRAEISRMKSLA